MAGTQLPPFFGLALLPFGMIAGPLLGKVAKAVAAEDASQAGQPLLPQPVSMVLAELPVVGQMSFAERFDRQIPGDDGVRPLALECLVERPAPAWFGILRGWRGRRLVRLCRLERTEHRDQGLHGQAAVNVGRFHMQPPVAAMPSDEASAARLDLQIERRCDSVQLRPALAAVPGGEQRRGRVRPHPGPEGLSAVLGLEVSRPAPCLMRTLTISLPRIDGVRFPREPVTDFQLGARLLQPIVVANRHDIPERRADGPC